MQSGTTIRLRIEKPAAGGRMIARADGQIVLVGGAIPGEEVTARIDRVAKGVAYAETVEVHAPSTNRRSDWPDLLCGGCLYGHVAYPRQLELKALVIADAFARIAGMPLAGPVSVAPSPEEGYRMRARLHFARGKIGFFREGTHDVCDARRTRQLLAASCDVLDRLAAALTSLRLDASEIELSENIDASERVVHVDAPAPAAARIRETLRSFDGLMPGPYVTDALTLGGSTVTLRRHVLSFFQGNRFLLQALAAHVIEQVPIKAIALDLYAGAGLFAVAAATVRAAHVTAVESDRYAAWDLTANRAAAPTVAAVHDSVEQFLARPARGPSDDPYVIIVDPPRVGLSREAVDGMLRVHSPRIIYVSCDVATLARDSRRIVDAGYAVARVDAFDLFPNTPHVETVVVFDRDGGR